ncbi:phiSA1p31-related protein [Streptomyces sp. NPDC056749]|uniref:phiSA1p31-related protein n=1 Tax=Streptomyces sp. NPDC056749 TaxID=3345936 RepID=UPI0036AC21F7
MRTYTLPENTVAGGMVVDLDRPLTAVDGSRWTWTGTRDTTGMPLVQTTDGTPAARLSLVYAMRGPLLAAPRTVTAADQKAALTAFTRPGPHDPTPRTVAHLLNRLHRRAA